MALSGYGANTAQYDQQASDAQYRYNTDRASNAYGRFLSQQRGERGLGDLRTNYNRTLPGQKAGYGQRGLSGGGVRSGTMQRSMKNFLGDYTQQYGRAQLDAQQEAAQYDQAGAAMDAYYNNSLLNIESAKQQEIANAALAIEALRPLLGGL
jgi:hypothetical protein